MNKDYLKLHLSILIASFTSILGRTITLNEGLLVWYRLIFAFVLLYVLMFFVKKKMSLSGTDFMKTIGAGMLMALHWVLFYGSIKYANVSVGIICFSLVGLFTALFEPFVNKHKISVVEILLSLLTLGGILLIFHFDSRFQVGIILGIFSSAIAALYTISNKKLIERCSSSVIFLYELLGGLVFVTAILPVYLKAFPVATILPSFHDLFYLGILALFCTLGLYILQIKSLKSISPFTVSLSYNLEPVYTIILAIIIFQENKDLNIAFYVGLALIFLSVVLQSLFKLKGKVAKI